jgi:hypothetical protein
LLLFLAVHARAAEDDGGGWHFDAGASVYVVDLPEYAPLWNFSNVNPKSSSRLTLINDPVVAPLLGVSLGRELADQWFVEARGEYAFTETRQRGEHTHTPPGTHVAYFGLNGQIVGYGTTGTVYTRTDLTFQEYGADLLAGKTFALGKSRVRPFAGYWFREMDVDYKLSYRSPATNTTMSLKESLETSYNGLLVGVDLSQRHGDWTAAAEITQGVGLAHTRYEGRLLRGSGWSDSLDLDKSEWAYRSTLELSLSTTLDSGWECSLTGGARYLSYVPRIVASGKSSDPTVDVTGSPTSLKGASSFSGKLGVEFGHPF